MKLRKAFKIFLLHGSKKFNRYRYERAKHVIARRWRRLDKMYLNQL